MALSREFDATSNDLTAAIATSRDKLRLLESVYRKNQIDAIMEMGSELFQLHKKYAAAGSKSRWKAEFVDLQLRMSRRTAERYRKIYNAFHECPALWERFKLGAMVQLAEFAEKLGGRTENADSPPVCLNHIKSLSLDWDGPIRRTDAEQYCNAWHKFSDRPELLKWFTFEALKLLASRGTDDAIRQAKYLADDLEQDATAGNPGEPIGLEQAQAIIENFSAEEIQNGAEMEDADAAEAADEGNVAYETNSAAERDSEVDSADGQWTEVADGDEVAAPENALPAGESVPTSGRKFVKTYKLSRCDISIASDIGPVTPDEIESILDELRAILQGEFENELSAAI